MAKKTAGKTPDLRQTARTAAMDLLEAGARRRKWSPRDKQLWTLAFNSLQRLAGKKIVMRRGKLVKIGGR